VAKTKELKKRYGAKRESIPQFWKPSPVRLSFQRVFTAPSAAGLRPRYVHDQISDLRPGTSVLWQLRLHRKNLVERLALEDQVARGSLRLCNLMVILTLMLLSLQLATNNTSNNAIRLTLSDAFHFESVEEATNLQDLWEALRGVSDACDDFFPSSR